MTAATGTLSFIASLLLYGAATLLFFFQVATSRTKRLPMGSHSGIGPLPDPRSPARRYAPWLLAAGAIAHLAYVSHASFVAKVCPVHSVHFILSVTSLFATLVYLVARTRFNIDALGLLCAPLGMAFSMGTYFLGRPGPEHKLSPVFIALHVVVNLLGTSLFVLAGAAATLYLVQEKRLKQKKRLRKIGGLPPLDTLDRAVHRFLIGGFPLLTIGIVTGTFWARQLEFGSPEEIMRIVFGYATWLLIAAVLLLRAAAGWRGRRAAYGTIAGLGCAVAVVVVYLLRPAAAMGG